ncbi:MAG: DedA family protein [Myxacorys chilensis ATA2-1-KO14]|jgi:membrane protein DedA with SNARE-associated domain|nr:DedA family protein [Myxacorys chilensis ATA2-1-KO14]
MLAQPSDLVVALGYLGVFLLVFLFPIPQELVLPMAGFITAQGKLNLVGVVIAGVMGRIAGSIPWYWAGRYVGEERLTAWARQHRWLKLSTRDIQRAKQWFDQAGSQAVLLSQFIPIIRTLIALPAGMSQMNLGLFLLCLVASASAWQGILAYAGYLLGAQYQVVNHYGSFVRIGVAVLIAIVMVWLLKRKR